MTLVAGLAVMAVSTLAMTQSASAGSFAYVRGIVACITAVTGGLPDERPTTITQLVAITVGTPVFAATVGWPGDSSGAARSVRAAAAP